MTAHTIFNKSGKWVKVCSARVARSAVIGEAKWEATRIGEAVIVKEGVMDKCGPEAVAIVTPEGDVW